MLKHHKPEATLDAPGINTGMFSHRDSCTLRWISISLDIELAIQNLPFPHPFKSKLFGAWRTDVVWTADVLATLILGGAGGKKDRFLYRISLTQPLVQLAETLDLQI